MLARHFLGVFAITVVVQRQLLLLRVVLVRRLFLGPPHLSVVCPASTQYLMRLSVGEEHFSRICRHLTDSLTLLFQSLHGAATAAVVAAAGGTAAAAGVDCLTRSSSLISDMTRDFSPLKSDNNEYFQKQ